MLIGEGKKKKDRNSEFLAKSEVFSKQHSYFFVCIDFFSHIEPPFLQKQFDINMISFCF